MTKISIHARRPSFNADLLGESPERVVSEFIACGDLSIDQDGHVWRHIKRVGQVRKAVVLSPPAKTETLQVTGYTHIKVNVCGVRIVCKTHRLVWFLAHGEIPEGCDIHHVNEQRSDNRLENLACLTRSKHQETHKEDIETDKTAYILNRSGLSKKLVSKIIGVSASTAGNKVRKHQERTGNKNEPLGSRVTDESAYKSYMSGKILAETAKESGFCVSSVSKQIERHCIRSRLSNPVQDRLSCESRDKNSIAFDLYSSGMTQDDVAKILYVKIGAVSRRISRYCLERGLDKANVIRKRRETNELRSKQS